MPKARPPSRETRSTVVAAGSHASLTPERQEAVAALLHRLNGGLNNTALALQLVAGNPGLSEIVRIGLEGVEQASRASSLLVELLNPSATPRSTDRRAYVRDLCEVLQLRAARNSRELEVPPLSVQDAAQLTAGAAIALLLEGLAAVANAPTRTALAVVTGSNGETVRVRVEARKSTAGRVRASPQGTVRTLRG